MFSIPSPRYYRTIQPFEVVSPQSYHFGNAVWTLPVWSQNSCTWFSSTEKNFLQYKVANLEVSSFDFRIEEPFCTLLIG